ncbi:MAG: hypothetical protein IJO93_06655 [Clostridia bacterium]|nr:hypothetical protein [Clostridia bacterium]
MIKFNEYFQKEGCYIIYGGTIEERNLLEKDILDAYPEYKVDSRPIFSTHKKVGPFTFKNKNSLWDILKSNLKIENEVLIEALKTVDLYYYEKRIPSTLTTFQKQRASLLYEVLNGKEGLLCRAKDGSEHRNNMSLALFLEKAKYSTKMIMINDAPFTDLAESIYFNVTEQDNFFHLIRIENGRLIEESLEDAYKKMEITELFVMDVEPMELLDTNQVEVVCNSGAIKKGDTYHCLRTNNLYKPTGYEQSDSDNYILYFPLAESGSLEMGDILINIKGL